MSNKYVSQFLKFNCAGDVLNAVSRGGRSEKEISESMAIIKHLKPIAIKEPMKYSIFDLCAGNALTSVLASHLLPIEYSAAVDKKKRKGLYDAVRRFGYYENDIEEIRELINETSILIAVHPCQTAEVIVGIFNNSLAHALIMMPCCNGVSDKLVGKSWLHTRMSEYDCWTYYLAAKIERAQVSVYTDNFVLSPKSNVIVARRGK